MFMRLFKTHMNWLVSDIFSAKVAASDVPPDSPGNGVSYPAEVCAP